MDLRRPWGHAGDASEGVDGREAGTIRDPGERGAFDRVAVHVPGFGHELLHVTDLERGAGGLDDDARDRQVRPDHLIAEIGALQAGGCAGNPQERGNAAARHCSEIIGAHEPHSG
jgi:hypothetical protein